MYLTREKGALTALSGLLNEQGIAEVPDVYSVSDLAELNAAMNPIFERSQNEERSYVRADDMVELGILEKVLSPSVQDILFSIMPDPVLYHLHAYEISANNNRSHIFGNNLAGWHQDRDSAYFDGDVTHASIFIYLTSVGENDGAFELCPQKPILPLSVCPKTS